PVGLADAAGRIKAHQLASLPLPGTKFWKHSSLKILKSLKQITLVKFFTVEGCEALLAGAGAAAAVGDAVGARAVPCHADHQPTVVAEVGWPPRLRVRLQGMQILDHRMEVEAFEFLGVVERLTHRIGQV